MKRVLLGGMNQESNSFVPGVTNLDTFRHFYLLQGQDVFSPRRGRDQEIDGVIEIARQADVELAPTVAAYAGCGPPVADATYQYIRDLILDGAREYRGRLDGVILALHGAMITESLDDPEGDLIGAVRDMVGPAVPIVVSLDMHAHVTDQIIEPVDAIVGYHTHPHIDYFDTGLRAMRLLVQLMKGGVCPVTVQRKVRMITATEKHNTSRGPMREVMGRIEEMESERGVLAATVFATQPWIDVAELGWSSVVVADGDRALAQARADELALMAWQRREGYLPQQTSIDLAVQEALASEARPYVLADTSDAVTAGSLGDGNLLLRALLDVGFQDTALLTVTDPEAAAVCFGAGAGEQIAVTLGGKLSLGFFTPVPITGQVMKLSDGKYISKLPPTPTDIGRTAVLQVGGISLVISERPAATIDAAVYDSLGLDPRAAKIVQVKSSGGFRAVYGPMAAAMIELDAPGPSDSDLTRLPYRRCRRPLWPFDPNLDRPW